MSEVTLPDDAQAGTRERDASVGGAFSFSRDDGGALQVDCAQCGHRFGPAERDPKLTACMSERTIAELSTLNESVLAHRLVARHFYCPSCGQLFAVNVQQHGDPIMLEWSIDSATLPTTV